MKFSDVLPIFTCASAIDNLLNICLGFNMLRFAWLKTLQSEILATQASIATSEVREASKRELY